MITFNNIVAKFQAFCDDHKFIQTFSYGSPADVDLDKFEQYPLLHLVYTGGDYNSERVKTYNLEVYILSVPPSEADKTTYQKESISDAEQVAEDILADIQNGGNIFSFGYHYDVTAASVTPLEEEKSNALAGCLLDISIAVPYSYDSCNAPLEGVDPEGSITPSYKARGLLRVRELDGDPDVVSVATINVPNGSLTDNGQGDITLTFGGDTAEKITFPVRNDEGATIPAGTPLYSRGEIGGSERILVGIADASDPNKMPAIGIAETELTTTGSDKDGDAMMVGTYNTNLSGFTGLQENDVLYVAGGGGLTRTKPTGTNLIQNVGIVLKTNGTICQGLKVSCIGRTNDVPNIPNGQTWIGNASGVATPTTLADVATAGTAISLTDIDSVGSGDIITDAERTKLTGIEAGAEVNPTASEIKTLYESNADTNAFTDAEQTKLLGIEAGAEVNPTASEIKTAYESNANTNAFTDAEQTKLAGIEAGAEVNPTASEIKTAYESNADTNAFTDAEKTKLSGIATGAEVNVNADWNAISGDAEILNKPTIPSAQVNSDWNSTSGVSEILNKPTIPANPAVEDNAGTPQLATGITQAEMQSVLNVDPAGTDNSTDVTLAGSYDYITIAGQTITRNQVDYNTDIANTPSIPTSGVDFDPVGTDNSTDVTLAGAYNYLTLAGQQITLGQVDYTTDISNTPTIPTSGVDFDPVGTDNSTDVSLNANANEVLRMNAGQILGAEDAGADKLVFWDDSEGKLTYATIGTNLTMTADTLSASGGGSANMSQSFTAPTSTGEFQDGARLVTDAYGTAPSATAGTVVNFGNTNVSAVGAQSATAAATGMLTVVTDAASADELLVEGVVKMSSNTGWSTAKKGTPLYMSTTAGAVTTTAPSTAGDYVRVVGHVVDATNSTIYFKPDNTWLEL